MNAEPQAAAAVLVLPARREGRRRDDRRRSRQQRHRRPLRHLQANSPPGCTVNDWECVRAPLTSIRARRSRRAGGRVRCDGLRDRRARHTGCGDYTPASLEANLRQPARAVRERQFPQPCRRVGRTERTASCGATTTPSHRSRSRTAFGSTPTTTTGPARWVNDVPGFFTGSGMPMRFAKVDGTIIDVYQATTQMTDESDQSYPFTIDTLLDRALGPRGLLRRVHGQHAHRHRGASWVGSNRRFGAVAQRALVSAQQMLDWLDGRNGSWFGNSDVERHDPVLHRLRRAPAPTDFRCCSPPADSRATSLTGRASRMAAPLCLLDQHKGVAYAVFGPAPGAYQAPMLPTRPRRSSQLSGAHA